MKKYTLITMVSASLTLIACAPTTPLLTPTVSASNPSPSKPSMPSLPTMATTEQVAFGFKTDTGFSTQAVDTNELKFIRLQLVGDGLSQTYVNDKRNNSEFIPVTGTTATATISGVPLSEGKLRVVTVMGYDANQQPLDSFVGKGYYKSARGRVQINIVIERRRLLAGLLLEKLLLEDPNLASRLDLDTLLKNLDTATGFNPTTGTFTKDPSLLSVDKLLTLVKSKNGQIPTATEINANASEVVGGFTLNLATPRGGDFAETVSIEINDPNSTPVTLTAPQVSPVAVNLQTTPGTWSAKIKDSNGNVIGTTTVTVDKDGNVTVLDNPIPVTAVEKPVITAIPVSSGSAGNTFTITGRGFDLTPGNNVVKFGNTFAIVTAVTGTSMTVTIPDLPTGDYNVSVTIGDQTNTDSGNGTFTIKPGISSLTPNAGIIGSTVTIAGTGFDTTPGNNTVQFGGITATVTAATATELTVTVPPLSTGAMAVTATINGETSVGVNYDVTPTLASLSASSGIQGSSVTLTGTGFDTTASNNTVRFGTTTATVTAATATSLTVTVPAAIAGNQNVTVQVGNQTSADTRTYAVTPTLASLSASSGAQGSSVTLTGTGFDTTAGNNTVRFGTTTATVTAATATSLTVTVPAAIAGNQNVTVQVGSQTSADTRTYAVTPTITSLSASSGNVDDSITVTGTGFDTTPGNNTVRFGTATATVTAATATSLTVTVPANVGGARNVTVQVGTQTSNSANFTLVPKLTAVSTTFGLVASTTKALLVRDELVTLTGTGFDLTTAGNNIVKFGTTNVAATAIVGATLQARVPVNFLTGDVILTVEVNTQTSNGITANLPLANANLTGGLF